MTQAAELTQVDPREVPVRFSNLKRIAQSPAHYLHAVQHDTGDSLALRLGRGTHALLFGSRVAVFDGIRNERHEKWQTFQAEHEDCEILNAREYAEATAIAAAISCHPVASELLFDDTVVEQRLDWEWMGRKCRSTPDVRGKNRIVELKTSRCTEPDRFTRDGLWRGYHAQLAFYQMAVGASRLGSASGAYVVAVESLPPYPVTVLRLTERAIIQGRKLCRLWFERLLACEAANSWPGYVDSIVDFDVPDDEFKLSIGGEEFGVE